MLTLAIFLLAVYGAATAVAVLKIGRYFLGTEKKRKGLGRIPYVGDLFYCPPCLAFWFGLALSHWISPARLLIDRPTEAMLVDGFTATGAVWILHLISEKLGHGLEEL